MLLRNSLAERIFVHNRSIFTFRHVLVSFFIHIWDVILIFDKMLFHVLFYLVFNLLLMFFHHSMIFINCVLTFLDGFCDKSFRLLNASFRT